MNFIEELKWRGMFHQSTPGVEEHLNEGIRKGYIGFDPTAPSLTIGNYVQLMILRLFQKAGHQPIVLMGGATGRIGDPSGKDKERDLKSLDELDSNRQFQEEQMRKFLDFETSENRAILVNNYDFYKNMNVLDFLRDIGKYITVNYMQAKDSVKNRLDGEQGMSFTEFSYQVIQGYDFVWLYQNLGCSIQMGGSDQWGNITSGTHLIGKMIADGSAFAVTTPLLTKADGTKFGKSEEGNIWLDPQLTTPYQFYQFWINANDADMPKFLRYFSFRSKEEIEALEEKLKDDPQTVKRIFAEEITSRIHSEADLKNVQDVTTMLFAKGAGRDGIQALSKEALMMMGKEIPSFDISVNLIETGINIMDLMAEHTQIVASKGDARRAIKGNAVSINKEKVTDFEKVIYQEDLLHGQWLMVENGKKNKFLIKVA